jgi:hypothetical protein
MLGSFPELSYLYFIYIGDTTPVLPDAFLGGFAPSLKNLMFINVAFPALSVFLSSTTRLTSLQLWGTPYISPEAMVTYFTSFHFYGIGEYSENILALIDAPVLRTLSITFSDVVFRIPQLYRFLSCSQEFEPPSVVDVVFGHREIEFTFIPSNNIRLKIGCSDLATQVSSMAGICRDLSPLLSRVERLDLHGKHLSWSPSCLVHSVPAGLDWLRLLYPFISVRTLYVSKNLGPFFIPALEELTKGATAVFPKLRTFFVEEFDPSGPVREAVEAFIATRSLSDHPVVFQRRLCPDSDARTTISLSS